MIAQMTHADKCSSGIRVFTACDHTASHTRVRAHHATPLSPGLSLKAVGSWLGRRDTLVAPPECLFPASSAKRRLSQLPCSFLASLHPRACVWACNHMLCTGLLSLHSLAVQYTVHRRTDMTTRAYVRAHTHTVAILSAAVCACACVSLSLSFSLSFAPSPPPPSLSVPALVKTCGRPSQNR